MSETQRVWYFIHPDADPATPKGLYGAVKIMDALKVSTGSVLCVAEVDSTTTINPNSPVISLQDPQVLAHADADELLRDFAKILIGKVWGLWYDYNEAIIHFYENDTGLEGARKAIKSDVYSHIQMALKGLLHDVSWVAVRETTDYVAKALASAEFDIKDDDKLKAFWESHFNSSMEEFDAEFEAVALTKLGLAN